MVKSSIDQAIQKIKSGKIDPLYFLSGAEKFFHDQVIDTLTNSIFTDKGSRDLNLTILYGTENTLGELLSAALSYPMLANFKLVIVRDFDKMKISDAESLNKYLNNLQKTTCLVLSVQDKGRSKIFSNIEQVAHNVDCKPIPDYKVVGWFTNYCKTQNIKIDPQAIHFLVNQVGSSLLTLNLEIQKALDYKNDDSQITIEDFEQTTGIEKDFSVFALQDALSSRRLDAALKICDNLIDAGQNINLIISILYAFFRKILIASSLNQKGTARQQIAKDMGLTEFQFKNIYSTINKYNFDQLSKIIHLLHDIDIDVKTSSVAEKAGLQMLCYKICRI